MITILYNIYQERNEAEWTVESTGPDGTKEENKSGSIEDFIQYLVALRDTGTDALDFDIDDMIHRVERILSGDIYLDFVFKPLTLN